MKTTLTNRFATAVAAFMIFLLNPLALLAQDAKKLDVDIDVNKGGDAGSFFGQPWVWIVGGAVFILLLVALMRGRGGRGE